MVEHLRCIVLILTSFVGQWGCVAGSLWAFEMMVPHGNDCWTCVCFMCCFHLEIFTGHLTCGVLMLRLLLHICICSSHFETIVEQVRGLALTCKILLDREDVLSTPCEHSKC